MLRPRLHVGKRLFRFWEVFEILRSVLDPEKCFGSWEVFLVLGSVFGPGSVFGFWELFLPMGHRTRLYNTALQISIYFDIVQSIYM